MRLCKCMCEDLWSWGERQKASSHAQRVLAFQQHGRAENKIRGILEYGEGLFDLEVVSIDDVIPSIRDGAGDYLPSDLDADLVSDYLAHPDLSEEAALLYRNKDISVVASGERYRVEGNSL